MRRLVRLLTFLCLCSGFAFSETTYNFSSGWQLFSLPYYTDPPVSPCKLVDRPDFVLFGIGGNQYVDCGALEPILPGQAFWVHLPEAEITFTGTPVDASKPYPIALEEGWNLIGNPFLSAISLRDARVDGAPFLEAEGVARFAYGFDTAEGNYTIAADLEPWKGYFVFARKPVLLELSAGGGGQPAGPEVVTIRIENAPGGAGAEVGALDLLPGEEANLWAAGYDAEGNYTGNVEAVWQAGGNLGSLGAKTASSVTFSADSGGRVGEISASLGALRDGTGRVVVISDSPTAVYPLTADDPVATDPSGNEYVADQLIVSVAPGTTPERVEELAAGAGARVVGRNEAAGVYQLKLAAGTPAEAAAALAAAPEVAKTSENYLLQLNATPNDPVYAPSAPAADRWAFEKIKMPLVWKEYTPTTNPVIAILDTGVDATHPELAGRVLAGKNFVDPANPSDTGDVYGHGTPLAGIAAAAGDNAEGMAGMCWDCFVLPVKVCTDTGACPLFSLLNGIVYAVDSGARVLNVSIGADFPSGSGVEPIIRAVTKDAYTRGALVVGAAGNGGHDSATYLPASDRYVLAVGATNDADGRAGFSNYGVRVSVSAPGEGIHTTRAGGGYATLSGTSESTAFVSGLAGLLLSIKSDLNVSTLESFITSNADVIATDQPIGGRINAYKAISLLSSLNRAPEITGLTPDRWIVAANGAIGIAAAADDPDGEPVTFTWAASGGAISGGGSAASWTAPSSRGTVTVSVTATDPNGNSSTADITIAVLDGPAVELRIAPQSPTLNQGDTLAFTAYAYDAAAVGGTAPSVPVTAAWTLGGGIGSLSADGVLAAINAGAGSVTAEADGLSDATSVTVNSTTPPILTPAATNTPCGNDWLSQECNLSRTSESSLSLTVSVPPKKLGLKCRYQTGAELQNSPIIDTTDTPPAVYVANTMANGQIYKVNPDDCTAIWPVPVQLGVGQYYGSPIMVNNPAIGKRIYIGSFAAPSGKVVAIDTSGALTGSYTLDANQFVLNSAPAAYASGTVNRIYVVTQGPYLGLEDGQMIALEDSGAALTEKWKHNIRTEFGTPGDFYGTRRTSPVLETVGGIDTVFFSTDVGWKFLVTALRADTGNPVWTAAPAPAPGTGSFFVSPSANPGVFTTPVVSGGYLYVVAGGAAAGTTAYVYKLNASTGAMIWEYQLGVKSSGSPAYTKIGAKELLFVGGNDRRVYAIRVDGMGAGAQEWISADTYGISGSTFSGFKPIVFNGQALLFTSSYNGAGEHIKILNISDGTSYQAFPAIGDMQTGPSMARNMTTGKLEVYFTSAQYLTIMHENSPPTVTNLTITPASLSPGDDFEVTALVSDPDSTGCDDTPSKNDIFKYPNPYPSNPTKADEYDVTLDHSSVSGASATDTFLYDDGTNGDANDWNCTYENDGAISSTLVIALGTPSGVYNDLCVTARDRAGETDTECGSITIEDATPTVETVTYVPAYVHNTGSATTTVNVVISDPNADITSVKINLSALGGGLTDITADCGAFAYNAGSGKWEATCTYDSITATTATTTGNKFPTVTACNSTAQCNSKSTTPLEVITVSKFIVTANPTTENVPDSVDVGIRAYDKYNNFMSTFTNLARIDLEESGAASGATLTWAGTGVTDDADGTGYIAVSTMIAGVATATLANTKAEGPIKAIASYYSLVPYPTGNTGAATGTNTDITWTAGALAKFKVTALNTAPLAGDTVNIEIKAYDAYDNFFNTYTNIGNPILLTNQIVATGLPSAVATWPLGSTVPSGGMVNGTVTMQIQDTAAEGPLRVFADDTLFGASGDTAGTAFPPNTDITWALGVLDHFRVAAAPFNNLAAGASATVTVTAQDAVGLTVTNHNQNTTITHALLPAGTSTTLSFAGTGVTDNLNGTATIAGTAFTLGVATFSVRNITAGEEARFTATYSGKNGNTGPAPLPGGSDTDVNWVAGALDRFEVTAATTDAIIGDPPVNVVINAYDAYDNFINTYTNAANVALSNAYSPPPGAGSSTISWGGASVAGGNITPGGFAGGSCTVTADNTAVEGPITVIATDSGGKTGNTNETATDISWDYGPVDHFDVVAAPFSDLEAGTYSTLTVTAYDVYDNAILNFNKNVAITHQRVVPGGTSSTLSYTGLSGATLLGTSFAAASATFAVRNTTASETVKFIATYLTASGTTQTSGTNVNWVAGDLDRLEIHKGACPPSGTQQGAKVMAAGETLDLCADGFDIYGNEIGATISEWCVDDGAGWCGGTNDLDAIPAGPIASNSFTPATKDTQGYIWARAQSDPSKTDLAGLIKVGSDTPRAPSLTAVSGENKNLLDWATPTLYVDGLPISQAVKNGMTYNIWFDTAPGIDCTSRPADYSTGPILTNYVDTAAIPWQTTYYRITAVNNNSVPPEESACSNEASATAREPEWTLTAICSDSSGGYLSPSDPTRFNHPMDAAVDENGFVYVADKDNNRVKKMTLDCTYIKHWGKLGSANGEFIYPRGIAYYNDEIYVTDDNNRVQVFDKSGKYLRKWFVQSPLDVEIDAAGTVYVSTEGDRVKKYTTTGNYLGQYTVINVKGIAVDGTYLYASMGTASVIRVINIASGLVVNTLGAKGTGYGQFMYPYDVDVDSSGLVFVADGLQNDRVEILNADGSLNNMIPSNCATPKPECDMQKPIGIGIAPTGELIVMDTYLNRIFIFAPPTP